MNSAAHGIWFTERAGVAGTVYHLALGIWLRGVLDEPALERACAAVVARHETLGSAVDAADGTPRFVPAAEKITLRRGDFSDSQLREEIARPYDLARGPLARFILLRDNATRHLLLFTAHHLVFDGMSKDLLAAELAMAYNGAELGPLPVAAQDDVEPAAYEPSSADVVLPGLTRVPIAAEPGATVEFDLEPGASLEKEGFTRFEVLLGAIHTLLARYGNTGLHVSIALSTRTAETRAHIGLFVNELPMTVGSDPRTQLRELYRRRSIPVRGSRPAPALTPVSVGYRKRGPEPRFEGLETEVEWALFCGSARNALHLQIVDGPGRLTVSLQYSPTAISAEAVSRIGEHLKAILRDGPDADLNDVPPSCNDTYREYPHDATVPALVRKQDPDAVAIVDSGRTLTYAQLDAASGDLAQRLRGRGVGPGDLVALRMDRSWQAVVAMLAVMRCGAAYVPVDPAYPPARQALILEDAAPALVLDGIDLAAEPMSIEDTAEGLAYVMYTSGSTGRPKGVVVSHGALANLLLGMAELVGSSPQHRWLSLTSLSFDISGLELFLPLITGGRVVIAANTSALDGKAVAELIRREGVTHVQATPSGWQVLAEAGVEGVVALCGGEALPVDLARRLRAHNRLINVYGPTETTIWSTAAEIPESPDHLTIGRPIANTQAYIVDSAMRPVPVGVPGELCLGGKGLSEGYLHQPELTAQRFVPNPFGPGLLYRTGDLCRWTADGEIVCLGRTDSQVKVRGHRVELEEIEARLREHPVVAHAAVALRADQLVGYIVADGEPPAPAELRHHVAQTLPAAMVPGLWMTLDRLPLTPNGKLDRAALPDPPQARPQADAAPAGDPEDEVTAALTQIWQEVLSIDDIGPDEDLFDLGGHSLTITRINARIVARLGVDVPLEIFFDTPTIAEIACYIREAS